MSIRRIPGATDARTTPVHPNAPPFLITRRSLVTTLQKKGLLVPRSTYPTLPSETRPRTATDILLARKDMPARKILIAALNEAFKTSPEDLLSHPNVTEALSRFTAPDALIVTPVEGGNKIVSTAELAVLATLPGQPDLTASSIAPPLAPRSFATIKGERLLRGIGNLVPAIIMDAAIISETATSKPQVREISIEEVATEQARIDALISKLNPEIELYAISLEILAKARNFIETGQDTGSGTDYQAPHRLNAEGAIQFEAEQYITSLETILSEYDKKMAALEAQATALTQPVETPTTSAERKQALLISLTQIRSQKVTLDRIRTLSLDVRTAAASCIKNLQTCAVEVSSATAADRMGTVYVDKKLSWEEILELRQKGVQAFLLDANEVGPTNHIMIFSHDEGIPIVLVPNVTEKLDLIQDQVSLDSKTGEVILNASPTTLLNLEGHSYLYTELEAAFMAEANQPIVTEDGVSFSVIANTKSEADSDLLERYHLDRIGLHRIEGMYLGKTLPTVIQLLGTIRTLADHTNWITIRLLDAGGDKPIPCFGHLTRHHRGLNFLLGTEEGKQVLRDELTAVLLAQDLFQFEGKDITLRITVPMVMDASQMEVVKTTYQEMKANLTATGIISPDLPDLQFAAMIEVPAAVSGRETIALACNAFSLGTNDLTTAELSIEREEVMTGPTSDWLHPAVLNAIDQVVQTAAQHNIPVSVCGEMAREPLSVLVLAILGIRTLSMDPTFAPSIKYLLRRINLSEWASLRSSLLNAQNAVEVRKNLCTALKTIRKHSDLLSRFIPSPCPMTYLDKAAFEKKTV